MSGTKRILSLVAMLLLLLTFPLISSLSSSTPIVFVIPASTVGDLNPEPGSLFSMKVNVSDVPDPGMWAYQFYLKFDPTILGNPVVPLANMNFTDMSSSAWTTTYSGTGTAAYGYAAGDGNPYGSGAPSYYQKATSTASATASLTFTTEQTFTLGPNWPGTPICVVLSFSYAVTGSSVASGSSLGIRVQKPDGTYKTLISTVYFATTSPWSYNLTETSASAFNAPGTYKFQIRATLQTAAVGIDKYVQVNWDDIGVRIAPITVTEGPFLRQGGSTYWVAKYINETTVYVSNALMGEPYLTAFPVKGNGSLADITFLVNYGATWLDLTGTKLIKLGDAPSYPPIEMAHTVQDGFFRNSMFGDYDGDRDVDASDLRAFNKAYGSTPGLEATMPFYPSGYNLLGSTQYVSGSLTDLRSNNNLYMTFRSYASATSAQALYTHQETTTIGATQYYLHKLQSADTAGTSLSASMTATGRKLLGKFVYPLRGVSSIPAGTWTMYYRAWRGIGPSIAFDAASSGNNRGGSTSVSWSHKTGSGSDRIMFVGVSIRTTTVSVSSIKYGAQSLTFIRADTHASATIRSELWYLISPASGTAPLTVTLSGTSKATGGSVTYTGVAQTSPLDVNGGGTGTSSSPSQSVTVSTAYSWLLGHLAISGSDSTVLSEGDGQTLRWDQVTSSGGTLSRNSGHGSDKGPVETGSQSVSWTLSASANWAVSVVAFKPAPPVGHVDVDILIRQSGGAIRTTIATNVANSADLTSTPTTLSGTYSWATYTVVDQTDYLEIDYYVDVTTARPGTAAYLRIDDNSLALADQTRATNIYLPSEFTAEVEFTGPSNTEAWTQLVWTIDSSFATESVTATFQLFNYAANAYPTSGDGYMTYTIGTADETKTQTITTNPRHFRDATGNWKIKIKVVKSTLLQFDLRGDLIEYRAIWLKWDAYSDFNDDSKVDISDLFRLGKNYGKTV